MTVSKKINATIVLNSNKTNLSRLGNVTPSVNQIVSDWKTDSKCASGASNTSRSISANSNQRHCVLLKPKRLKDNYGIDDLRSEDETDDEEEPRKPIPEWAQDSNILRYGRIQAIKILNYTKLFKASCEENIKLENVFKVDKNLFQMRSSSADWSSPPVWRTNGITGFMGKNYNS